MQPWTALRCVGVRMHRPPTSSPTNYLHSSASHIAFITVKIQSHCPWQFSYVNEIVMRQVLKYVMEARFYRFHVTRVFLWDTIEMHVQLTRSLRQWQWNSQEKRILSVVSSRAVFFIYMKSTLEQVVLNCYCSLKCLLKGKLCEFNCYILVRRSYCRFEETGCFKNKFEKDASLLDVLVSRSKSG